MILFFFLSWNTEVELKWNFSFELYFKMYILIYPKKKKVLEIYKLRNNKAMNSYKGLKEDFNQIVNLKIPSKTFYSIEMEGKNEKSCSKK